MDFLSLISLSIVVFASTNIDDIFVLMLFFADRAYNPWQVVVGQYLGIGVLIGVSIVLALAAVVFSTNLIGLLGFVPIAIGIKKLLDLRHNPEPDETTPATSAGMGLKVLSVAGVTISNGGDNIGVYVPLFATSTGAEVGVIAVVFAVLVGLWCLVGYWLVKHTLVGDTLRRFGARLLPFVLIGLGVYILAEAYL